MNETVVRDFILELISEKLVIFNISRGEVNDSFDLVKSGLLDSMAFVDLVAELEEKFEHEIDFEEAAEEDDFTSLGGLIQLIMNTKDAG